MKANELRIGNFVTAKSPLMREPFQVYPQAFSQIYRADPENGECHNWEPIPLTEEWLMKFGFEENSDTAQGWVTLGGEDKYLVISLPDVVFGCIDGEFSIPEIKYVHQLQNLYFALTGGELIIKEN